jgi:signal transduction histidine kinase
MSDFVRVPIAAPLNADPSIVAVAAPAVCLILFLVLLALYLRRRPARRRLSTARRLPPHRSIPQPNAMRHTVLVVDDDPMVVRFVERALCDTYAVVSAQNGREALDRLDEAPPDLIISDVMMPVMDGHELCRRVKSDAALRHVPLVLLTALASQDHRIEGLEMGSDDYIFKPFHARELSARVGSLIRAREEQRRLAQENRVLSTESEMKTELLSLAAHDLKNPLAAIRELADMIREELGDESDAFMSADMIHRSSNEMLQLIASLLESTAMEDGRIPVRPEIIDLAGLAAEVIRRNDALARRKGQTIEMALPAGECAVKADPHLSFEAMDNLVNNAVKYAPHGSTIHVEVSGRASLVRFSVTDAGPGLSHDEQQRLFQRFEPLSARPTGEETSTGLGLSIVKQIVDLHQGSVEVRSAPGAGSTFTIELSAAGAESALFLERSAPPARA